MNDKIEQISRNLLDIMFDDYIVYDGFMMDLFPEEETSGSISNSLDEIIKIIFS